MSSRTRSIPGLVAGTGLLQDIRGPFKWVTDTVRRHAGEGRGHRAVARDRPGDRDRQRQAVRQAQGDPDPGPGLGPRRPHAAVGRERKADPSDMTTVGATELRARFARRLSELYGQEVPRVHHAGRGLARGEPPRARAGREPPPSASARIDRVTAERHGAIRVGTPEELGQVARDLRRARHAARPASTTCATPTRSPSPSSRPRSGRSTATSWPATRSASSPPCWCREDRRFFDADLEQRLTRFLAARRLFPDELLDLADRAEAERRAERGGRRRGSSTSPPRRSRCPPSRSTAPGTPSWSAISGVAADIGGVTTTHINHLTPRVLDIDDLYREHAGARHRR